MNSTRSHRSAAVAVLLSFLWPGLGQAFQRRYRAALLYALPVVAVVAYTGMTIVIRGVEGVALELFDPSQSQTVLVLAALLGVWRILAMVDVWVVARRTRPSSLAAAGVLAILAVAVIATHGYAGVVAWSFYDAGRQIFEGGVGGDLPFPDLDGESPGILDPSDEVEGGVVPGSPPAASASPGASGSPSPRLTVLLTGIDKTPTRNHSLTDTLLLVSVDPTTGQGAMVSIPRDVGGFPLYSGGTYTGKINSLLGYVSRHRDAFPDNPTRTLMNEVGYLVGVPVPYYAAVDLTGFVKLVDLVGGVTVDNPRAIDDNRYGGWTDGRPIGFHLPAGRQRLDAQEALAFARSRMGAGDSDFTRADRQQILLLALRRKLTTPEMLPRLPSILAAAGDAIKTNVPAERLPELLDVLKSIDGANIERAVLGPPYSRKTDDTSVYMLAPDLDRWARLSVRLFGADSRYAPVSSSSPTPPTTP